MSSSDWNSQFKIDEECFFTREQLLERDDDPIANGMVDLAYLNERFGQHVRFDHAAAVRAILVREGKRDWRWIWGIGLLHDQILKETGYQKLYARYRNQRGMLPRIEFHGGADLGVAIELLLKETPLERGDVINIESEAGGRWMSIGDYLGEN